MYINMIGTWQTVKMSQRDKVITYPRTFPVEITIENVIIGPSSSISFYNCCKNHDYVISIKLPITEFLNMQNQTWQCVVVKDCCQHPCHCHHKDASASANTNTNANNVSASGSYSYSYADAGSGAEMVVDADNVTRMFASGLVHMRPGKTYRKLFRYSFMLAGSGGVGDRRRGVYVGSGGRPTKCVTNHMFTYTYDVETGQMWNIENNTTNTDTLLPCGLVEKNTSKLLLYPDSKLWFTDHISSTKFRVSVDWNFEPNRTLPGMISQIIEYYLLKTTKDPQESPAKLHFMTDPPISSSVVSSAQLIDLVGQVGKCIAQHFQVDARTRQHLINAMFPVNKSILDTNQYSHLVSGLVQQHVQETSGEREINICFSLTIRLGCSPEQEQFSVHNLPIQIQLLPI
jgi:hypothetical protein